MRKAGGKSGSRKVGGRGVRRGSFVRGDFMELRLERETDYGEVEQLTREAFWDVYHPGATEHLVLHQLRKASSFLPELDYVAVDGGRIVGNIVYSRMYRDGEPAGDMIAFGPVSVLPDMQGRGIGKRLISETLTRAKALGFGAVMITGNPGYYHKFGFEPAGRCGLSLSGMSPQEDAPFFMVKELCEGVLKERGGAYAFDPCFDVSETELQEFEKMFPPKTKREPRAGDLE